jgi:hypothetical protein
MDLAKIDRLFAFFCSGINIDGSRAYYLSISGRPNRLIPDGPNSD